MGCHRHGILLALALGAAASVGAARVPGTGGVPLRPPRPSSTLDTAPEDDAEASGSATDSGSPSPSYRTATATTRSSVLPSSDHLLPTLKLKGGTTGTTGTKTMSVTGRDLIAYGAAASAAAAAIRGMAARGHATITPPPEILTIDPAEFLDGSGELFWGSWRVGWRG